MTGTGRRLRRLRIGLYLAVAVAAAGAVLAINGARSDADTVRTGVAPAREGLAAARQALVEADTQALAGFRAGSPTVGPDPIYQFAVAAASRQLAQVSQADLGGTTAEGVQVVESLVFTYLGLMEQSRTYLAGADDGLAEAYLQYAHTLLVEEILPQLQSLRAGVESQSPGPAGAGRVALWLVPLLVLLGLLIVTQVFLARRFRRTLSLPMLLATAFALALGGFAVLSLRVDRQVDTGRATLATLVSDYQVKEAGDRARGCKPLGEISRNWPRPAPTSCPSAPPGKPDRDLLTKAGNVGATTQRAADTGRLALVAVVVLAALTALSIMVGLQPRIEEYRFRSR